MKLAAAALQLSLMPQALAQQPGSTFSLSCNGTSKLKVTAAADLKPEPITGLSIIIDFSQNTVFFNSYVVPIKSATASRAEFAGRQKETISGQPKPFVILGSIDWATGATNIDWLHVDIRKNARWELTCLPVMPT